MAAVYQPPRQRRLRSASDPFVDPSVKSKAPLPPPKSATPHTTATRNAAPSKTAGDITDAVRDTVTVRTQDRSKMNRSQMNAATSSSNSRPSGRRSQSEDSGQNAEKTRNGKPRTKKGSQHADVIDRLDFTSVGPMFHHDGPFDACAPSRNKHRNVAPLYAWGEDVTAAQLSNSGSAYPSAHAYAAFSNDYTEPPKKKVDALAEAWGIHEPEPFEDFSAGGGTGKLDGETPSNSIYNGRETHSRSGRRPKESRERPRRAAVPPPQPIFVEPTESENIPGSPPASPGFPKRSKSIMQRLRKMRDAPNIPVGRDYDTQPGSPNSPTEPSRPTHRPQNSFLGRLAGGSRANQQTADRSEPFVFIEATREDKDLPPAPVKEESATPPTDNEDSGGYFDGQQTAGGLGRKASIIKRMGKVVRTGTK